MKLNFNIEIEKIDNLFHAKIEDKQIYTKANSIVECFVEISMIIKERLERKSTKKEISEKFNYPDYEEMSKILKDNGWNMSWSDDNWVHNSWPNQEANCGIPTKEAYRWVIAKN